MKSTTVEILLATYNGGKYLREQLNSIFGQTYSNFKLTIRDDGSTDNTVEIVEEYVAKYGNRITILPDDGKRLGSTQSFAALIEVSTENYVMLCDQDDFWCKEKIELTLNKMLELEKENGSIPLMVFTDLKEVDQNLKVMSDSFIRNQKLFPAICDNATKLIALNVVAGCTTMFNRAAIKVVLPIPAGNIVHDQWIAINVAKYGKIAYLDRATILYRQHTNNAVGAKKVGGGYFLKKLTDPAKQFGIYKTLIENLSFKVFILGFVYYKILFTIKRLRLS
jgi:glycosyltransferase involved in cell wall biosynthesis